MTQEVKLNEACGCPQHMDHKDCDENCNCTMNEETLNEISLLQRLKRGRKAKQGAKKSAIKRARTAKKMSLTPQQAQKAAENKARQVLVKKLFKKDKASMSNAEKQKAEKKMSAPKFKAKIKKLAKKLLKVVKKDHKDKAKSLRDKG